MELWSANIWLKHSSTNYAVSFLYLTHKKLIWRETSLIQSGKSSILPNHSPRINALAKTVPLHLQTHVETCSPAGIWLVTVTQTSALFLTSVAWKSFRHSHYLSQQQHENFFYSLFSLMVFTASESVKNLAKLTPISLCTFWKSCANSGSSCSSKRWNTRAAELHHSPLQHNRAR